MNRGSGLLLLFSCVVLLGGCSTVNTRSVKHYSRLDHQGRGYEIGGSGEVLEYPLRGKSGTYEVVKKHLESFRRERLCLQHHFLQAHLFLLVGSLGWR